MTSESLKSKSKRTVWVSNIDLNLNKDGLFGQFSTSGNILDIQLPKPALKYSR